MNSQEKRSFIIAGGSLAGLFAGIVLKRLGHTVTILERSPTSLLHSQGAGIVMGNEAQTLWKWHMQHSPLSELTVTVPMRQTLKRNGEVDHEERLSQQMVSWDKLYFLLRGAFDGLESAYGRAPETGKGEGEASYQVGKKVVGVKDLGDEGVDVEFEEDAKETAGSESQRRTIRGDIIVAADGSSSVVRQLVCPEVERVYVGYAAWRGTVPEDEASEDLKKIFVDRFSFFHDFERGIQILAYLIPRKDGNVEDGSRLINWVWYCNYPAKSAIYKDLMTDSEGHHHRFTLPVGKIQPKLLQLQKDYATDVLAPPFAELVRSTQMPFVQCITDVLSPRADFMDGKLLLVGDAVAGFRPHTAASTNQAAYDALLLEEMMKGEIHLEDYLENVMQYARRTSDRGKSMGDRSQFSGKDGKEELFGDST